MKKVEINGVNIIKLLGLTFDQKLTWFPHLKLLKQACSQRINVMKALAHYSWEAD